MPRVSAEAVARDREKSRARAAARRSRMTDQERFENLKLRREYETMNAEHINELRRTRYGADIAAFASRPFIFWDGEGYTDAEGNHHYMLFGCSMYPDAPIVGPDLATEECLEYLLRVESHHSDAFHVGFVFDYDVNMILRDLESRNLRHLAEYGIVHWRGYRIVHIPGKIFRVSRKIDGEKVVATVFDVFGFFHSKFTTSILKFGVASEEELTRVFEGKSERGNFTFEDIEYVKAYWQAEISFGAPLMECIRDACYDAGLFVTQWHGPGALASYILRKRGVQHWKSKEIPHEVQIAIRSAYAGGRFHTWRCGLYLRSVYTADINSAYIFACSLLPNLANGRWLRIPSGHVDRHNIARFGIYRIAYDDGAEKTRDNHRRGAFEDIHPLFHRDRIGNLYWPPRTEGWYWSPEASLVKDNPSARFLEAWVYDDDGTSPFGWVDDEFNKRLELQHEGNPAEKTFKWALAAMYGAFARTVGWDRKTKSPPRSHELSWAGFITSWCRAEMYRVAYECWKRGGLISIDTDGVTSTVPFEAEWLGRGVGEKLGQWKLEKFAGIMYWQSGFYWLMGEDGKWTTAKTRGIKRGSLDVQVALDALENASYKDGDIRHAVIEKVQTRFIGYREALNRRDGMKSWRKWTERPLKTYMGQSNTSIHAPLFCRKCRSPEADMMHVITHLQPRGMVSQPHRLPWLEDQPKMPENYLIVHDEDEFDNL
jgi:hypothetical protein